ncbi:hypothetical protein [Micromonospora haikouensis]|uniref:hypothetical protein n=1 Tax=Micromonospora haikouensis TaxID=686309 RepID=UPI0037A616E0
MLRFDLVAFLVLVSGSGVSPAVQMRYGTAEQPRRNGYGDADLAELGRAGAADPPTVCRLDGCDHYPTLDEGTSLDSISPQYSAALLSWLDARLPAG